MKNSFALMATFQFQDMLNIVSAYLPVTELVDEAFEIADRST